MRLTNSSNKPWLEVITGPMFSGKSELIAQKIKRIDYYNRFTKGKPITYVIYRPENDTRSEDIRLIPYEDWFTSDIDALPDEADYKDIIIIDDAQFFRSDIIIDIKALLRHGKHIIVSGLDKDYKGYPFSPLMESVIAMADECHKLTAVCVECGDIATMTKLISDEELPYTTNIMIESCDVKYVPVCRTHFIRSEYGSSDLL